MKVLIDNLLLIERGGIYVYFNELFKSLKANKVEYHAYIYEDFDTSIRHEDYTLKKKRLFERVRSCKINQSCNIFHSSYYRIPADKKIKVVTTVHDFTHQKFSKGISNWIKSFINLAIKKRAFRRSDALVCISNNTKKDLLQYYKPKKWQKIHVIYNGISENYYRKNKTSYPYEKYFLFVGHRTHYKNWNLAMDVLDRNPDYNLVVVGGNQDKKEFFSNIKNSLKSRIHFKGFITEKELNDLYNQAFCLFYPSSYEGFGIPVIEAMAAGCPVIANKNCLSVYEIAKDEALFFNLQNNKKEHLVVFDDLKNTNREELIIKGLTRSKEFSWSKNFSKIIDIYNALLD